MTERKKRTASRRKKSNVRQRQHMVGVRLLQEEHDRLREAAERDQVSPAEVLRRAFLDQRVALAHEG